MAEPMNLPKGIIVNHPDIPDNIAEKALKPLTSDELLKFWKVYTTTKRMLKDPTAERLENLFWRIWGSRDTKAGRLSSQVIATVFSNISNGVTASGIRPLRSCVHRDESGIPSPRTAPLRLGSGDVAVHSPTRSAQRLQPPKSSTSQPRSKDASSHTPVIIQGVAFGQESSLTSEISPELVPMPPIRTPSILPPPILKKARGQSSTGPKPTARFANSPPKSDTDHEQVIHDDEEEVTNSNVTIRPPTPDVVLHAHRGKAYVVHKSGGRTGVSMNHRKRPGVDRRLSSQSSTSSESTRTYNEVTSGGKMTSPTLQPTKNGLKSGKQRSKFRENVSPAAAGLSPRSKGAESSGRNKVRSPSRSRSPAPPLSEKARGKQRACSPGLRTIGSPKAASKQATPTATRPFNASPENAQPTRPAKPEQDSRPVTQSIANNAPNGHELGDNQQSTNHKHQLDGKKGSTQSPTPMSALSKRSMSAANLSAAYPNIRRASTDKAAAQISVNVGSTLFDGLQGQAASPPRREDGSVKPRALSYFTRPGIFSRSLTTSSPLAYSQVSSTHAGIIGHNRSVSNLAQLLHRDDEAKAKGNRTAAERPESK